MVIEGKVARVLNSRELIINKGIVDGIEIGMRFDVQGPGLDILDPDSRANLGHLVRSKIRVQIVEVEHLFSIARTFETYQSEEAPASIFSIGIPRHVTKVKTLRTDGSSFEFREDSANVSVGDRVVQIQPSQL